MTALPAPTSTALILAEELHKIVGVSNDALVLAEEFNKFGVISLQRVYESIENDGPLPKVLEAARFRGVHARIYAFRPTNIMVGLLVFLTEPTRSFFRLNCAFV